MLPVGHTHVDAGAEKVHRILLEPEVDAQIGVFSEKFVQRTSEPAHTHRRQDTDDAVCSLVAMDQALSHDPKRFDHVGAGRVYRMTDVGESKLMVAAEVYGLWAAGGAGRALAFEGLPTLQLSVRGVRLTLGCQERPAVTMLRHSIGA